MTERLSPHINADPDTAEQSFAGPVLTVVEFLRQLVERQAIRRVDDDTPRRGTDREDRHDPRAARRGMDELCGHFDLRREDLNLDLGPLGTLPTPG